MGESYSRTRLTALARLAIVAMGFGINLAGAALPQIREDLGVGMSAGGWLMGAYSVGFLLGLGAGAAPADRGRWKEALLGAAAVYAASWSLMGRLPWPASNFALQFTAGLGGGVFQATVNTLLIVLHRERAGPVLNVSHAFVALGAIGGPIALSGILALGGSWKVAFLFAATVPAAVLLWALVERFPARDSDEAAPPASAPAPPLASAGSLLRDRGFQVLAATMVCYIAAEFAVNVWIASYLTDVAGLPDWVGKWSLSAFWVALGSGRLVSAAAVARWGMPPVMLALSAAAVLTYAAALAAGGSPLAPALFFLYGLACSGIFPTLLGMTGERFPARAGAAVSLLCAFGTIGSGIVPPAMGMLADRAGLGPAMWAHAPFLLAMLAGACRYGRRERA